jgi:hypothetical protein
MVLGPRGEQGQDLGVFAQRGGVVFAAGAYFGGPQWSAVGGGDDLDVPAMVGVCWVGSGRGAGLAASPFPRPARRTRRAILTATGSPRVLPVGQPLVAAAGFGVHGVGMLLPR